MLTDEQILAQLTDVQVAALTALREAVGDRSWEKDTSSVEERIAVLTVIRNRVRRPKRFGDTFKAVCLAPKQFSCWNRDDPNRPKALALGYLMATRQPVDDRNYLETEFLAQGVVAGLILDRVNGSNHYHTTAVKPPWAKGQTPQCQVGSHLFYLLD